MLNVTGANGFIGQAILGYCDANGIAVRGFSRTPPKSVNITQVADYSELIHIVEGEPLIHLAECSVVAQLHDDLAKQQYDLLDKLCQGNFSKLVYASSAAIYDSCNQDIPVSSNGFVDTVYANAKRRNESLVLNHKGGIAVRLSNVIGKGMNKDTVIPTILSQLGRDLLTVFTVKPIRDYVSVNDVASALTVLALSKESGIFHIGSGVGHSVSDLIESAARLKSLPCPVIEESKPSIPNSRIVLNISDSLSRLNWRPLYTLEDALLSLMECENG